MAKPPPLILLSVLATAMLNLTLARALDARIWRPEANGLLLGFSFGQVVLLTLWLVFGGQTMLLRLVCLLATAGFWAELNSLVTPRTDQNQWLGALALFIGAVAAPLLIWRAGGIEWVNEPSGAGPGTQQQGQPPCSRQFSLGTLLAWMTGSCVVLAILRGIGFPWDHALQVIVYCLGFALVGLLSLVALIRSHRVLLPVLAAGVVSPALGWLIGARWEQPILISVICMAEMATVSSGALLLRTSGLRLDRKTAPPVRFPAVRSP